MNKICFLDENVGFLFSFSTQEYVALYNTEICTSLGPNNEKYMEE